MHELTQFGQLSENKSIKEIRDNSSNGVNRMLIEFTSGVKLSVVSGHGIYQTEGNFEIAFMDKEGNFIPELFEGEDSGDDVCGYCEVEKIKRYIDKVGKLSI